MSTAIASPVAHGTAHLPPARKPRPVAEFLSTYVFSKDHKVIGLQFLFSTLVWFLIGGLLALAVRWQIAWPWSDVPVLGKLFAQEGGQMAPEFSKDHRALKLSVDALVPELRAVLDSLSEDATLLAYEGAQLLLLFITTWEDCGAAFLPDWLRPSGVATLYREALSCVGAGRTPSYVLRLVLVPLDSAGVPVN